MIKKTLITIILIIGLSTSVLASAENIFCPIKSSYSANISFSEKHYNIKIAVTGDILTTKNVLITADKQMNESTKSDKPRVLVVKLSALGDLFHSLPAVHNLKVGLGAEIDWVTQKEYVDLVRCFTDVDRVIPFYRKAFFTNLKLFLEELRTRDYDYVIDLQGLLKSAIVARLARGKERIGPSFHREGSHLFYSAVAGEPARNRHAVEENLDIVRHLGR